MIYIDLTSLSSKLLFQWRKYSTQRKNLADTDLINGIKSASQVMGKLKSYRIQYNASKG